MDVPNNQAVEEQRLLLKVQQQEIQAQRRAIKEQWALHEQRRQQFEAQMQLLKIKRNQLKYR